MKQYNLIIATIALLSAGVVSCDDPLYDDEQYHKEIYLLSEDQNIYSREYSLEEGKSTKSLSILYTGSTLLEKDVTVHLELEPSLVDEYNKRNFDVNSEKFAHLLSPDLYSIDHLDVTMKTDNPEVYTLVNVTVDPSILSPDSIYFIPLKLKEDDAYQVNADKSTVLFAAYPYNKYASVKTPTYYVMVGSRQVEGDESTGKINGNKLVKPLSANQIRLCVDSRLDATTLDEIAQYCMVLTINEDNSIGISAYNPEKLELQEIKDGDKPSVYDPETGLFTIYYKYKEDGKWVEVMEMLMKP